MHFVRNALAYAHKGQREMIAAMIRPAFAQPNYQAAVQQWRQVVDNLRPKVEKLAALMGHCPLVGAMPPQPMSWRS